jgi:uncharacterized protein YbjT (DUF2867 family)
VGQTIVVRGLPFFLAAFICRGAPNAGRSVTAGMRVAARACSSRQSSNCVTIEPMSTQILVTGATGKFGREVLKQLAVKTSGVAALARNPEKAREVVPEGVRIVIGDLSRLETLAPALEGIQKVLLASSADPHQGEIQSNLVQAARKAGVGYIVKLSAIGATPDSPVGVARAHARTEQELADSGIAHTNLRPNFFMQNLLNSAGAIAARGEFYSCAREGKGGYVDISDIAAVAVACLTSDGHAGKSYLITGAESLSLYDIAAKLSAAAGKPVRYVDLSPEAFRQALLKAGFPEWRAEGLVALFSECAAGRMDVLTDVVQTVAGKQPVTFDEFARKNADAFRKQGAAA